MKQQETLRYQEKNGFANVERKRKIDKISQEERENSTELLKKNTLQNISSPYLESAKKKRLKDNNFAQKNQETKKYQYNKTNQEESKLDIQALFTTSTIDKQNQWLTWKSNSCRLDAFFTILIFTILNDERFSVTQIKKQENKKFKEILIKIQEATDVSEIQFLLDQYALYRQRRFKEKVGEKYSITPLFNIFNIIPEFLFDLKDKKICNCGNAYVRDFQFGSLILLTT